MKGKKTQNSSANYSTSSNKQSSQNNNKKYREKPEVVLKLKTEYLVLVPEDVLYRQNLSHLSSPEYRFCLQRILMDLNALLYFTEDDFFEELQKSDSLRRCLQSCLTCLGKNSYYNVSKFKNLSINRQQLQFPNQYYLHYEKLHEVLLKIYYRIVNTDKVQYKQLIYDCWLLDVPKMIDLVMIYCIKSQDQTQYLNLELIKEIIHKAISTNPKQYANDFDDFINTLYQDKLPLIHQDMKLVMNLEEQTMQYAKINFANPERSFLITANKILFEIKDIFTIVSYVYLCFPQKFQSKLATDHQVLEDMIKIFLEFVQSAGFWKTGKHKEKFETNFQAIYQACCECFYDNFKILKQIIDKGDTMSNEFYSRALNSYCVHSMYFTSQKINKEHQKIYEKMIKTIVYRLQPQNELFFMQEAPSNIMFIKLSEDEKVAIRNSHVKINKIYGEIEQVKENQEVQRRIKAKIDGFFEQIEKSQRNNILSEQNRIVFHGRLREKKVEKKEAKKQDENKQLQGKKEQMQQKQENNLEQKSLDFSALHEVKEEQNIQPKQDGQEESIDLSFNALKSSSSSSSSELESDQQSISSQMFTKIISQLVKPASEQAQISMADPELYSQLEEKQNQLQAVYRRSRHLLYQDDFEELREERMEYYKSHKPEFGHFLGRLLERR